MTNTGWLNRFPGGTMNSALSSDKVSTAVNTSMATTYTTYTTYTTVPGPILEPTEEEIANKLSQIKDRALWHMKKEKKNVKEPIKRVPIRDYNFRRV